MAVNISYLVYSRYYLVYSKILILNIQDTILYIQDSILNIQDKKYLQPCPLRGSVKDRLQKRNEKSNDNLTQANLFRSVGNLVGLLVLR